YADFYGLTALHDAGIDGRGEHIGIVGVAPVDPGEVALFRGAFDLPPLDLLTLGTPPPDIRIDDRQEAILDVCWSGAVAPGAAVVLAVSSGTLVDAISALVNRSDVGILSLSLAPVPSKRAQPFIRQSLRLFQQAAAQGQTVLIASGDTGPLAPAKP